MANGVEFVRGSQHTSTEPDSITLHAVSDDIDIHGLSLDATTGNDFTLLDAPVDSALDVTLKAFAVVLEHGGASGQNDVLVQATTGINRRSLNDGVHNLGKRGQKVRAGNLGVEKDFGTQKAFVTNVYREGLLGHAVFTLVLTDPFLRFSVVFGELLHQIGADVAVGFLDTLGNLHGLIGRDLGFTFTQKLLNKLCDGTTCNGNVFNS
eukprot:Lithocolla_globosa_v1_NODE_1533_length_2508_cov_1637.233184.p2 type:complete len:208 gc:universal NODE_1533_length_2508_cov_1637.233184:491-1114(+)